MAKINRVYSFKTHTCKLCLNLTVYRRIPCLSSVLVHIVCMSQKWENHMVPLHSRCNHPIINSSACTLIFSHDLPQSGALSPPRCSHLFFFPTLPFSWSNDTEQSRPTEAGLDFDGMMNNNESRLHQAIWDSYMCIKDTVHVPADATMKAVNVAGTISQPNPGQYSRGSLNILQ